MTGRVWMNGGANAAGNVSAKPPARPRSAEAVKKSPGGRREARVP